MKLIVLFQSKFHNYFKKIALFRTKFNVSIIPYVDVKRYNAVNGDSHNKIFSHFTHSLNFYYSVSLDRIDSVAVFTSNGYFWFASISELFSPRESDMSMFMSCSCDNFDWNEIVLSILFIIRWTRNDDTERLLLNYNLLSKNASQINTHSRFEWKYITLFIIIYYHLIGFFFKQKESQKNPLNTASTGTCALKIKKIFKWTEISKSNLNRKTFWVLSEKVRFGKDENASLPFAYLTLCIVVEGIKGPWPICVHHSPCSTNVQLSTSTLWLTTIRL